MTLYGQPDDVCSDPSEESKRRQALYIIAAEITKTTKTAETSDGLGDYVDDLLDELFDEDAPTVFRHGGTGAAAKVRAAAEAGGYPEYVAFRIDRAEDVALAPEAAPAFIRENRDHELFENLRGDLPHRAIFDLDGCDGAEKLLTVDDFESISAHVVETALACGVPEVNEYGVRISAPLAASFRKGKASAHVISSGFRVADGPTGRVFGQLVRDSYAETAEGQALRARLGDKCWVKLWDLAKSGAASRASTMCMRLVGVPKVDGRLGRVIPDSILVPSGSAPPEWGLDPVPWLLQGDPAHENTPVIMLQSDSACGTRGTGEQPPVGDSATAGGGGTVPDIKNSYTKPHVSGPIPPADVSGSQGDAAKARIRAVVDERANVAGVCLVEDPEPAAGSIMSWSRVAPGWCPSCEREHDRAGAYAVLSSSAIFANCRRAAAEKDEVAQSRSKDRQPLAVAYLHPGEVGGDEPTEMPERDEYECISNVVDNVTDHTSSRYNGVAFKAELSGTKDIYLRAPWKSGKTFAARKMIALLKTVGPRRQALLLTMRQSLTTKIVQDLREEFGDSQVVDYRDIKRARAKYGRSLADVMRSALVIVCQVDSMHKLPSDLPPFGLVMSDEPAALAEHIHSETASRDARAGGEQAGGHIEKADRLYVCDNDLNEAHVRAFQNVREGHASAVLWNKHKSWAGTAARLF